MCLTKFLAEVPEHRRAFVKPILLQYKHESARGLRDDRALPIANAQSATDMIALDIARSNQCNPQKRKQRNGGNPQAPKKAKTSDERKGTEDLSVYRKKIEDIEIAKGDKVRKRELHAFYKELVGMYGNRQNTILACQRTWFRRRQTCFKGMEKCIAECCDGDFEAWLSTPWPKSFSGKDYVCPCIKPIS
jgi:hypothetical protein